MAWSAPPPDHLHSCIHPAFHAPGKQVTPLKRVDDRSSPVSVARGYYFKSECFPRGGLCFSKSGQLRDGIGRGPLGNWQEELRYRKREAWLL